MSIEALEAENRRLKKIIEEKDKIIHEKDINFHMDLYEALMNVTNSHGILLTPHPINLKCSYKNRSEKYNISAVDVILVTSDGRTKEIWLKEKVSGSGESERNTDKIFYEGSLEELKKQLDPIGIHFVRINRSVLVNARYFRLSNKDVVMENNLPQLKSTKEVRYKPTRESVEWFMVAKNRLHEISLQKKNIDDIIEKIQLAVKTFGA